MAAMVVQLGLAMMPLGRSRSACGLTSLTTSGTSGSLRQAEELSTTTAPAAAKRGACSREAAPPAEKMATSMPLRSAVATSSTSTWAPRKSTTVPALRAEEKKRTERAGKSRSASMARMTRPTWPVAPTTATETPSATPV